MSGIQAMIWVVDKFVRYSKTISITYHLTLGQMFMAWILDKAIVQYSKGLDFEQFIRTCLGTRQTIQKPN